MKSFLAKDKGEGWFVEPSAHVHSLSLPALESSTINRHRELIPLDQLTSCTGKVTQISHGTNFHCDNKVLKNKIQDTQKQRSELPTITLPGMQVMWGTYKSLSRRHSHKSLRWISISFFQSLFSTTASGPGRQVLCLLPRKKQKISKSQSQNSQNLWCVNFRLPFAVTVLHHSLWPGRQVLLPSTDLLLLFLNPSRRHSQSPWR